MEEEHKCVIIAGKGLSGMFSINIVLKREKL
jgi:hypothetical protein